MQKMSSNGRRMWDLDPHRFNFPDYLEFQEDLKNQFRQFQKADIFKWNLMEAWGKCAVIGINFTSDTWRMKRWATIEGFKEWPRYDGSNGVPKGWKERYGTDVGYWIELREMDPSEIRKAVKQLSREEPDGWGIKIKPKEFYRVLFFYEVAHSVPICGRFLNELSAMKTEERLKFEREAWLWGVKMARQRNPEIRIICDSRKKEKKLEHSNYCQWYGLLKRDEEFRKRKKSEPVMKKKKAA